MNNRESLYIYIYIYTILSYILTNSKTILNQRIKQVIKRREKRSLLKANNQSTSTTQVDTHVYVPQVRQRREEAFGL
jgi:hypothetical protein